MPAAPVLRFEDVRLAFDEKPALDGVSFEIWPGDTRVILGSAGSGKTSLLKTALGLLKPDSGRIFAFGEDITDLEEHSLFPIRARMGVLFQEGGLFDSLTIEENVSYPLLNQPGAIEGNGARPAPEIVRSKVEEALRFVELEHTLEKFPSQLSGGMRRRVGIARATVTEPALLLYDSPTAGLDPITANTIIALLVKERDLRNATSLIVTHRYQDGEIMANYRYNQRTGQLEDASQDGSEADLRTRFMVLQDGRLVFDGPQSELEKSTDPYISKFVRREG